MLIFFDPNFPFYTWVNPFCWDDTIVLGFYALSRRNNLHNIEVFYRNKISLNVITYYTLIAIQLIEAHNYQKNYVFLSFSFDFGNTIIIWQIIDNQRKSVFFVTKTNSNISLNCQWQLWAQIQRLLGNISSKTER